MSASTPTGAAAMQDTPASAYELPVPSGAPCIFGPAAFADTMSAVGRDEEEIELDADRQLRRDLAVYSQELHSCTEHVTRERQELNRLEAEIAGRESRRMEWRRQRAFRLAQAESVKEYEQIRVEWELELERRDRHRKELEKIRKEDEDIQIKLKLQHEEMERKLAAEIDMLEKQKMQREVEQSKWQDHRASLHMHIAEKQKQRRSAHAWKKTFLDAEKQREEAKLRQREGTCVKRGIRRKLASEKQLEENETHPEPQGLGQQQAFLLRIPKNDRRKQGSEERFRVELPNAEESQRSRSRKCSPSPPPPSHPPPPPPPPPRRSPPPSCRPPPTRGQDHFEDAESWKLPNKKQKFCNSQDKDNRQLVSEKQCSEHVDLVQGPPADVSDQCIARSAQGRQLQKHNEHLGQIREVRFDSGSKVDQCGTEVYSGSSGRRDSASSKMPIKQKEVKEWKVGDSAQFYSKRYRTWVGSVVTRVERSSSTGKVNYYDLEARSNLLPDGVHPLAEDTKMAKFAVPPSASDSASSAGSTSVGSPSVHSVSSAGSPFST